MSPAIQMLVCDGCGLEVTDHKGFWITCNGLPGVDLYEHLVVHNRECAARYFAATTPDHSRQDWVNCSSCGKPLAAP